MKFYRNNGQLGATVLIKAITYLYMNGNKHETQECYSSSGPSGMIGKTFFFLNLGCYTDAQIDLK